jgi:threonine synthase
MALEIAEPLGWRMPDVIVYPTAVASGSSNAQGAHRAARARMGCWNAPSFVCVPVGRLCTNRPAFEVGAGESQPWPDPHTIAFVVSVPKALGDFLGLRALYETDGIAVAVERL